MQAASRRAGAQLLRRAKHGECRQRPLLGNPSAMRPNILLITADQWRGDSFGAAGHPVLSTPAIDALAVEGVCFLRHYAQAAPCSPGREIGRAHVCTPVTNAHLVCILLLDKNTKL